MRSLTTAASTLLWLAMAGPLAAQTAPAGLPPGAVLKPDSEQRLSPHVWVIRGFPNVVIVGGAKAALVIDTGLGPANGQVVARTAAKLAKGRVLYLTTTHFHPEHAAGEGGFPAGTILLRPKVQEDELEADKGKMLALFRQRGADLPTDFSFRRPDRVFDTSETLDLGGVHARLVWAGPAHTRGDEEVLVEEDSVLVTGDVVQNKTFPIITAADVGPRDWIRTVDALAALHAKLIVPDHSDPGPGDTLIRAERDFLQRLDDRAHALKASGATAAQAGETINAEFKAQFPDWAPRDLSSLVAKAYAE